MPQKPRKPAVDYAIYLVVRAAVCFLNAVPIAVALRLADGLAWVAFRIDKRHRDVARENVRIAFPALAADPAACDRLVRACYRHYCTMLVEIVCLPRRMHLHNWRRYTDERNLGLLAPHLISDRGLLMVTCHYGNWEVAGYITGLTGHRTYAIARVLDNPHVERFFKKFRQKTGQTILAKSGDFELIEGILVGGGKIATLGDQDAGPKGLFVDFFGRPASTHKAVALMAIQYDVPLVVLSVVRVARPTKFCLWISDVIDPRDYQSARGDVVRQMTERFTRAFEGMIREHPEQYFWLHRRWKHQPPARKAKAAAPA